jgi:hypothetical protein
MEVFGGIVSSSVVIKNWNGQPINAMQRIYKNSVRQSENFIFSKKKKIRFYSLTSFKFNKINSERKYYLERDEQFHHSLPSFTNQTSAVMTWSASFFSVILNS